MNLKIQHRNFDIPQTVQRLIERKAQKVQKMLPTFSNDTLDLHVTLEKLPRGSQYGAVVVLTIPQTAIRVEEMADNPTGSVQASFDELLRKIKKFKSQLSREKFWQRQPETTPRIRTEGVREFENLINQNLDKIQNYVRRELFHKSLAHNIPPGILQPEAVVDEVFLLMSSQEKAKPGSMSLEQWMYQVAREQIDRRLDELDRDAPHIEDSTPQAKPHWEDEVLNFYQPDEALKLEDVLSDKTGGNPELLMANFEKITHHLRDKLQKTPGSDPERETLNLVRSEAGRCCYVTPDGNYWRAYRFVGDCYIVNVAERPAQAREAGRAFGRFQKYLADLPAVSLHETIPYFHHTPRRLAKFKEVLKRDARKRAGRARDAIAFVLERESITSVVTDALESGRLPLRITHNDTKINNVLFDNTTGQGLCVIDLDTTMPGSALYDFGDMVRTTTSFAAEDERDLAKVKLEMGMFKALARG